MSNKMQRREFMELMGTGIISMTLPQCVSERAG